MRIPVTRSTARAWLCTLMVMAVPTTRALSTPGAGEAGVSQALAQFVSVLPGQAACGEPEAWSVHGSLPDAAGVLLTELRQRGWPVMEHGPMAFGYALLADPDPDDPSAMALGGVTGSETPGEAWAFLVRCSFTGGEVPGELLAGGQKVRGE